MKINFSLLPTKFLAGLLVGAVLFSGSAVAYNSYISDNTPEGGYLLCANTKTKTVTFPNKLSCPAGTTPLDMGAISLVEGGEGPQGAQGAQGPAGPAGQSVGGKVYWSSNSSTIDIVADGAINSSSAMVRKVMLTLKSSDVPSGYYRLTAHIGGNWADSANTGSLVKCYFQDSSDYDANSTTQQWGGAASERKSWNNVDMNVLGDWSTSLVSSMHLVCKTSGTLKGLRVSVDLESATLAGKVGTGSVN